MSTEALTKAQELWWRTARELWARDEGHAFEFDDHMAAARSLKRSNPYLYSLTFYPGFKRRVWMEFIKRAIRAALATKEPNHD